MPGGRYSWEFSLGVCRPVLQILTRFQIRSYTPRKPYPIPDQNGQSVYPFSDQNGAQTHRPTPGAAYTYMAYMWEYPPGTLSAGPKGVPRLKES